MNKDSDELMRECRTEWFKTYLEWLLDNGQISKQSTLQTHWKFLRLGYVRKFGKMDPDTSLELTTVSYLPRAHYTIAYAEIGWEPLVLGRAVDQKTGPR